MALPNLLIVGAAKCGTTTLHTILSRHPQVYAANPKEPKYFSHVAGHAGYTGPLDDQVARNRVTTAEEYQALYEPGRHLPYRCDASADNLYYHRTVIPLIQSQLGQPAIIIMLRDPVARTFSAYHHLVNEGRETSSLEQALEKEASRIEAGYEFLWHYRACSLYCDAVRAYKDHFEHVHVMLLEDLGSAHEQELGKLARFLSTTPFDKAEAPRENAHPPVRSIALKRILDSESRAITAMRSARPASIKGLIYQSVVRLNQRPGGLWNARTARRLAREFSSDVENLADVLQMPLHEKWLARYGL